MNISLFYSESANDTGSGSIKGPPFLSQSSALKTRRGGRYWMCEQSLEFTGDGQLALGSILL